MHQLCFINLLATPFFLKKLWHRPTHFCFIAHIYHACSPKNLCDLLLMLLTPAVNPCCYGVFLGIFVSSFFYFFWIRILNVWV